LGIIHYIVLGLVLMGVLYLLFGLLRRKGEPQDEDAFIEPPHKEPVYETVPPAEKKNVSAAPSATATGENGFARAAGPGPLSRAGLELETLWRLEHLVRDMQNPSGGVVQADFNRDPREVALALASNPMYAARILKTVNSAAFGLRQRIDSLSRAITYLGYNQVKNIVFQGMTRDHLGLAGESSMFDQKAFWRHSHAVSVAAEHILKELDAPPGSVGPVTTAALLHDIGWVVFERFDRQAAGELFARLSGDEAEKDSLALEQGAFGFDHPLAGSLLAEQWRIPDGICRLIWLHHAASSGLPESVSRETAFGACVISLAEKLAHECGQPHPLAEPQTERISLPDILGVKAASTGNLSKLRQEIDRTMRLIDEFSRTA